MVGVATGDNFKAGRHRSSLESAVATWQLAEVHDRVRSVRGAKTNPGPHGVGKTAINIHNARALATVARPWHRGYYGKPGPTFTNIWGSGNREGLLTFAKRFRAFGNRAFAYIIFKRFAVLTKVVNFLIEPMMTGAGYDFYSDGFALKYTNYIHYELTEFADPSLFDAIISAYQAFSRSPSPESLRLLQWQLNVMKESNGEPVQIFLDQMATGTALFDRYNELASFRGSDELQVTTMHASIGHWRQRRRRWLKQTLTNGLGGRKFVGRV